MTTESTERKKSRIVIIGGGFGGAYCARYLEKATRDSPDLEVLLIDKKNYMIFTPLLVEAGTGSLEPRHAVVPLREFVRDTNFLMAEVQRIDTESQKIHCVVPGTTYHRVIEYDHLVLAPGSVTRRPNVPGLKEFAFELKSLIDGVALRDRGIQMLEIANSIEDEDERKALLHFMIVGASYTGVEIAGEYLAFLHKASRSYRNIKPTDIHVTLVEVLDRILTTLDIDLALFATKVIENQGAEVLLNTSVKEIRADQVELDNGRVLDCHTLIWTGGIAPSPLMAELPCEHDKRGNVICNPDLSVKGLKGVWAIGDSASNPDENGDAYPPTAQHATRQGTYVAKNVMRVIKGEEPVPCVIKSQGSLAALGCRTGVANVLGVKLSGFPAWFLWRTVYLMKMPTWSRRIRVALDWTLDLFLRADIVQLGVHGVKVSESDVPISTRGEGEQKRHG